MKALNVAAARKLGRIRKPGDIAQEFPPEMAREVKRYYGCFRQLDVSKAGIHPSGILPRFFPVCEGDCSILPPQRQKKDAPSPGRPAKRNQGLFFELVPIFLLDESGQRTTIFRFSLEGIAGAGAFAEFDRFGDFGLDFLLHLDVVEIVFHGHSSRLRVSQIYPHS